MLNLNIYFIKKKIKKIKFVFFLEQPFFFNPVWEFLFVMTYYIRE